jgi:hypothetical protein
MFEFVQTEVNKDHDFHCRPTPVYILYPPPHSSRKLIELQIIKEKQDTCIYNYNNVQVAWVRVDTQTILTIDDMVITRSQRISVRHMTDASVDYPYYLHHPHQHAGHHKNNNKSLSVSEGSDHPGSRRQVAGAGAGAAGGSGSIHKTWQLIIREVQSSDAGLYVSLFSGQ